MFLVRREKELKSTCLWRITWRWGRFAWKARGLWAIIQFAFSVLMRIKDGEIEQYPIESHLFHKIQLFIGRTWNPVIFFLCQLYPPSFIGFPFVLFFLILFTFACVWTLHTYNVFTHKKLFNLIHLYFFPFRSSLLCAVPFHSPLDVGCWCTIQYTNSTTTPNIDRLLRNDNTNQPNNQPTNQTTNTKP